MKAFPGFMAKKPVRSLGSVEGDLDVIVDAEGRLCLDLGPKFTYPDPKFRLVTVAGEIIWAEDDQSSVYEETIEGAPHLVLKLAPDSVPIPTTGATLHVRTGSTDREFFLLKKATPFDTPLEDIDLTTSTSEESSTTETTYSVRLIVEAPRDENPQEGDLFGYARHDEESDTWSWRSITWGGLVTRFKALFDTKSEVTGKVTDGVAASLAATEEAIAEQAGLTVDTEQELKDGWTSAELTDGDRRYVREYQAWYQYDDMQPLADVPGSYVSPTVRTTGWGVWRNQGNLLDAGMIQEKVGPISSDNFGHVQVTVATHSNMRPGDDQDPNVYSYRGDGFFLGPAPTGSLVKAEISYEPVDSQYPADAVDLYIFRLSDGAQDVAFDEPMAFETLSWSGFDEEGADVTSVQNGGSLYPLPLNDNGQKPALADNRIYKMVSLDLNNSPTHLATGEGDMLIFFFDDYSYAGSAGGWFHINLKFSLT